ncbi:MAG: hypothetical protein ACTFAL_16630 [Candidatus Electronema sp. V4]|uniref:hypothetical protein n=1 Tax=Candidatus Electronema sp. V4 TaxID=3454756 RepID=UPI0040555B19
MELKITSFYCLCDDFLISNGWRDDLRSTMSTAEVMTAAPTAAAFFSGSYERKKLRISRVASIYACHAFKKSLQPPPEQRPSVWRGLLRQLAGPFHETDFISLTVPLPARTSA